MTGTITVEVTRGPGTESRHAVHAVIVNGKGDITAAYGNPDRLTFPRSTLKPLQALPLVETGAAEHFALSQAELALACASHAGEAKHTGTAESWLRRIGLDETALECGAHAPYSAPAMPPCVLCNNCSGKHTGMVTLAKFMKTPHAGYVDAAHPVQKKILAAVGEMCAEKVMPENCGIDGCSAPNPLIPLASLARGFAKFMRPEGLPAARAEACRKLYAAMAAHPDLVSGTNRLDTVLIGAAKGEIVSKAGGEGVYICLVPGKDTAVALKAEDGAMRAVYAGLFAVLEKHKLANDSVLETIRPHCLPVQKNWRGIEVGIIRV